MICFSFGPIRCDGEGPLRMTARSALLPLPDWFAAIGMNGRFGEAAQRHEVRPTGSFAPGASAGSQRAESGHSCNWRMTAFIRHNYTVKAVRKASRAASSSPLAKASMPTGPV